MTDVAAAAGRLSMSNALHFGGVAAGGGGSKIPATTLTRKTPSELRGELLKRKNPLGISDESASVTNFAMNADGTVFGPKKSDSSKAPRFTRMDEHYPVTKISRLLRPKEYQKENVSGKCAGSLKDSCPMLGLNLKDQVQTSCLDDTAASEGRNGSSNQTYISTEKSTSNTFKTVRELSLGGETFESSSVDMGEALKGLVSCEPHAASAPLAESIDRTGVPRSFSSEIHVPGQEIPLDLTLKTNMHLMSSSPIYRFHRLINSPTLNDMGLLLHDGYQSQSVTSSQATSTSQIINHGTFHSWVHPQSTLPREAISALASIPGGKIDILYKRQQAWKESFRSLYYMLRRKRCKIFYVCSVQFVVMFTVSDGTNKTKCSCYAYVSQSTRNLRSLLKEHDVFFSMPLCRTKVEEVTVEDLVELSEIEKHNLGKTRAMESMTGVDNTTQSLLMFSGKNVHALYDFLLNYRSFYTPLTASDVPVLYSPVPFENATLSAPEVRCKQARRVYSMSSQLKDSSMDSEPISSTGICYSVEISDAYIPPWVICGFCEAMRTNGATFKASFVTESTSIALNVGLDKVTKQPSQQANADEPLQEETGHPFGIPNTTLSLQSNYAYLKGLKYGDSSYTAFLSSVE